ncbi:MAG: hypothetical protein AAF495_00520 [Pseudomonadota bacterium]
MGIGLTLLILALIALSWPYRRARSFTLRMDIAAPREQVWGTYVLDLEVPESALLHDHVKSATTFVEDPTIKEVVIDSSGGHGTETTTLHLKTLTQERPRLDEVRTCRWGSTPYPYGENEVVRFELEETGAGSAATLTWQGETLSLWQCFNLWKTNRRHLKQLKEVCETGKLDHGAVSQRSLWICLAFSALAILSFTYLLGWIGGLVLAVIVVIHEFGHWLALKLTGQPAPRVILIPFLGGIATANHRHKSLFHDAFCSLMGPGFSVLPCGAFLVAALVLGLPDYDPSHYDLPSNALPPEQFLSFFCLTAAWTFAFINLLQMVPVLPLDGGQVLRALVQSFSGQGARWILLALTGLAIAGLLYASQVLIAAVLGLGALQAWHMKHDSSTARAMNGSEMAYICLGYLATLGIYGAAIVLYMELTTQSLR